MNSSFIGKIDKARKYAEERGRVTITDLKATFQGDHNSHEVVFDSGSWNCQCLFFTSRGVCSHTMALQRILEDMLDQEQPHPAEAL